MTSQKKSTVALIKSGKGIIIISTLCCILWGSAFPMLKYSYGILGIDNIHFSYDIQFAGYRFFIASLIVLAFLMILGIDFKIKKNQLADLLVLALLQTSLSYAFFYVGISNTTSIKASILQSCGTFFSVILPHFFYADDKMNIKKASGLAIGMLGVVITSTLKGGSVRGFSVFGEGFLIISALINAFSSIHAKNTTKHVNPFVMSFYSLFIGSVVLISTSFLYTRGNVLPITASFMPALLYLGFISGAAISMWNLILKYNKVTKVAVNKFQIPIWGVLLSTLFIKGERLNLTVFISLILVCCGIAIVSHQREDPENISHSQNK